MYYIETNAIYGLSNILCKINKENELVYTSYLTILELISGINDDASFLKRKRLLQTISDSKIKIIWETPRQIVSKAYQIDLDDSFDINITQIMYDRILNENSYIDIKKYSSTVSEECKIEYFHSYDRELSASGVDISKEEIMNFSNSVQKDEKKEIRHRLFEMKGIHYAVLRNIKVLIRTHLDDILNITQHQDTFANCIKKYDESLDIYFYAHSYKGIISKTLGQIYGTNDLIDLAHLLYLDEDNTIISSDHIFKKLAEETGIINCIDNESAKTIFNFV